MHHLSSRRRPMAAAVAALALVLTACGDDDATDGTTPAEPTGGTTQSPSAGPELPTDGAIGPEHEGELPTDVDHVNTASEANTIEVGHAATDGEVSGECLGNELGLVVSLSGDSAEHGLLTAVLSFQAEEITSVVVQSSESPDGGGPIMWMTSSGPGEELTVTAEADGAVWTVTGTIGGFDSLTQTPVEDADLEVVADCTP